MGRHITAPSQKSQAFNRIKVASYGHLAENLITVAAEFRCLGTVPRPLHSEGRVDFLTTLLIQFCDKEPNGLSNLHIRHAPLYLLHRSRISTVKARTT